MLTRAFVSWPIQLFNTRDNAEDNAISGPSSGNVGVVLKETSTWKRPFQELTNSFLQYFG